MAESIEMIYDSPILEEPALNCLTVEIAKFNPNENISPRDWLNRLRIFGDLLTLLSDKCIDYIIRMSKLHTNQHISAIIIGILLADPKYVSDTIFKSDEYINLSVCKLRLVVRGQPNRPLGRDSTKRTTNRNRYRTQAIHLAIAVKFAQQMGHLLGDGGIYLLISVINLYLDKPRYKPKEIYKVFKSYYLREKLIKDMYTLSN